VKKVKKPIKKELIEGSQHTSVSYPRELFNRLEKGAKVLKRTRNNIVNLAVEEYLDRNKVK